MANPAKLIAIEAWPAPHNKKELCGFLGLTGYYHQFRKHYGQLTAPLYQVIEERGFSSTLEAQRDMDTLKQAMLSFLVLALHVFSQEFVVDTNASGMGVRVVLCQSGKPIAFFSQTLST